MAIKSFNPYSPSRRFITVSTFEEITLISLTVRWLKNCKNMQVVITPAK